MFSRFALIALMLLLAPLDGLDAHAADAAPAERFAVLEFVVEGNSKLPPIAVERAVYKFLGPDKSIVEIEAARSALEHAYRDAGYLTVLVDIPEQKVDGGLVMLTVTEAQVDRLKVTGSRYYSLGEIRRRVSELADGSVPHFPTLQKQLAKLAGSADRVVQPVLKPARTPGKVDAELKVEDRLPLHGSLELNDRYSAGTERWRLTGSLRYENLWQREHALTLGFQTAPQNPSQAKVLSLNYKMPSRESDRIYAFYAVRSRSDVATGTDFNVLGNGDIYGARAIFPFGLGPGVSHSVSAGVDFKRFRETIHPQGQDSISTPISYAPFQVAYNGESGNVHGTTRWGATTTFLPRGLSDGRTECGVGQQQSEFACKRFGARPNFFALKAEVARTQRCCDGWELSARLDGQYAGQPLISSEQFSAGGLDSVRGYLESEAQGDDGVHGGLELRTPRIGGPRLGEWQMLAFVEGASLRVVDPLPDTPNSFVLASAGLGLRVRAANALEAALDVAWPYKETRNTDAHTRRIHVRLAYEF